MGKKSGTSKIFGGVKFTDKKTIVKHFREHIAELLIFFLTALAGTVSIFTLEISTACIIFAIGFSAALVVLSVKWEVISRDENEKVDQTFKELFYLYSNIPIRWSDRATNYIQNVSCILEELANGKINIYKNESYEYQSQRIKGTKLSIMAIHIGTEAKSLSRWNGYEKKPTDFGRALIKANLYLSDNIPTMIAKLRLFIISETVLIHENLFGLLEKVIQYQKQILGFDARILSTETIMSLGFETPKDTVIIDGEEVITVDIHAGADGNEIIETEATIQGLVVQNHIRNFDKYWNEASTLEEFKSNLLLPSSQSTNNTPNYNYLFDT